MELIAELEAAEDQLKILKGARTAAQDEITQLASTSAACCRVLGTTTSLKVAAKKAMTATHVEKRVTYGKPAKLEARKKKKEKRQKRKVKANTKVQ